MQLTTYEVKPEDLEKGLRNNHYKKFEREQLMEEHEINSIRNHQIERKAGFFDKKKNIFEEITKKEDSIKKEFSECSCSSQRDDGSHFPSRHLNRLDITSSRG